MKQAPSTFSLILGLVALALTLALTLAAILSMRVSLRAGSDAYGHLSTVAALAADELSTRNDPNAAQTMETLRKTGLRFSAEPPPSSVVRPSVILKDIGYTVGQLLGDPSRVVVVQTPDPQIWVRSAHDPQRWIVLHALSYRRQIVASTFVITVLAGLIALIIAALAARMLTRPLESLTAHASELLSGEPVVQTHLSNSPREVRKLALAIGDAGEKLRSVARERELMLAGISHDLRTPLARLRLALELGDACDPYRRDAMVADLDELDSALEQCLAFVRDGRDEPRREIDLVTLVGQLLALRAQPDTWQLSGPSVLPANVRPSLLRRAIGNLMDNAERYGAAPFEVSLSNGHSDVVVRVTDSGPGVNPELLAHLGRPFMRGDQARGGVGTGLGLSIALRAAELHGGAAEWSNVPEGGFAVTLRLPAGSA
ncbi:ATP-binding protein [Dyella sp. 2HG41-7]|uniref:ATP-binding protein n=1 Tax=Dyella sp. 2HG41-7 TaxID=2883239 RepID=UPI001F21C632|nr:ATP-binding protein [Dyella sp. 2HG41-7]